MSRNEGKQLHRLTKKTNHLCAALCCSTSLIYRARDRAQLVFAAEHAISGHAMLQFFWLWATLHALLPTPPGARYEFEPKWERHR